MQQNKLTTPEFWFRSVIQVYLAIATLIQLFTGGKMMAFYAAVALALVSVLPIVAKWIKLKLNPVTISLCFIFLAIAIYTGNRYGMYHRFWWYDVALHFSSGILLAMLWADVAFPLPSAQTKPTWRESAPLYMVLLTSVVFAMACACGWELTEFFWDILTKSDVQRNLLVERELFGASWQNPGIRDTMNDMLNGTVGALVGCACIAGTRLSTKKKSLE